MALVPWLRRQSAQVVRARLMAVRAARGRRLGAMTRRDLPQYHPVISLGTADLYPRGRGTEAAPPARPAHRQLRCRRCCRVRRSGDAATGDLRDDRGVARLWRGRRPKGAGSRRAGHRGREDDGGVRGRLPDPRVCTYTNSVVVGFTAPGSTAVRVDDAPARVSVAERMPFPALCQAPGRVMCSLRMVPSTASAKTSPCGPRTGDLSREYVVPGHFAISRCARS